MGAKNRKTVRHGKGNNQGISLVELIVAITILSIVVVTFLHAFITAANTTVKAKRIAQATEVGRNIMEGLEPYRFKEIAYQFNYPEQGFSLISGIVADRNNVGELDAVLDESGAETGSYKAVIKAEDLMGDPDHLENQITSSIVKKEAGSLDYSLQEKNVYYFKLQNLSANGVNYDALVAINPGSYGTMADPANPNEDTDGINTVEFTNVKQMTLHDGVSMFRDRDHKADIIRGLQNKYNAYNAEQKVSDEEWVDVELTEANISREVVVTVYNDGSATMADVSYQYVYANGAYRDAYSEPSFSFSIFDNSENTDCDLQNIYLFLDIWNSSDGILATGAGDKITIENRTRKAVNFFLVEQKDDTDADSKYSPNVYFKQTGTEKNTICTNLNMNADYYHFSNNNGISFEPAGDHMVITGLTSKKRANRMYDISVAVYPSGSYVNGLENSEPIITLTGGMLD